MVTEIVDLDLGSNSSFKIITMQGDIASRFIEFHLTHNNETFDLTGKTVSCRYLKDDKTVITTNLVINDKLNGICTLDVPYELMKNPYIARSELVIKQSKEILSTIPFTVEVVKSLVKSSAVESTSEFGALNDALWKIDGFDSRLNSLSSRLDNIKNNIENNILNLKTEKYIFIGDSYGEGFTPQGNVTSWIDYTKQLMHLSDDDCYSYAVGGYGFTTGGFKELINRAVGDIVDKEKIKYIVVGGGYNDSWNYSKIANSMKEFFNICNNNFPNSKIIIAPFGWCVEGLTTDVHVTQTFSNLINMVLEYQRNAVINGGCYVDGIYSVLHKNEFFSSDFVHPNNNGQYAIALAMSNYLKGNGFSTVEYMNNENVFKDNVYEKGINVSCQCISTVENKTTILHLTSGVISGTFTDIKLDGSSILLGKVRNAAVNGCYEKTVLPVKGILKTHDSHYYDIDFILHISHNKLYMNIVKVNDLRDNFSTLSFTEIKVNPYSPPISINSLIN